MCIGKGSEKTMNELYHYGMPRRSGRYPYGSGDRPFQSASRSEIRKLEKGKERSDIFRKQHIIPKGTNVYLVSKKPREHKTTVSVSYLNIDRSKSININSFDKTKKSYERKMKLTEDLKVPSRDHLKDTIEQQISKNPKLLDSAITSIVKDLYPHGVSEEDVLNGRINGKKKTYEVLFEQTYKEVSNQPLEKRFTQLISSFSDDNELKKSVINKLSEEGYNGIVDESKLRYLESNKNRLSGVIQYQKGADPIMVFDINKITQTVSEKEITEKDEKRARRNSVRWQTEKGRLKGERKDW